MVWWVINSICVVYKTGSVMKSSCSRLKYYYEICNKSKGVSTTK